MVCAIAHQSPNLLEMQVDPEKDEWPQQHGEDCRDDRLHCVEMLEVVVPDATTTPTMM